MVFFARRGPKREKCVWTAQARADCMLDPPGKAVFFLTFWGVFSGLSRKGSPGGHRGRFRAPFGRPVGPVLAHFVHFGLFFSWSNFQVPAGPRLWWFVVVTVAEVRTPPFQRKNVERTSGGNLKRLRQAFGLARRIHMPCGPSPPPCLGLLAVAFNPSQH